MNPTPNKCGPKFKVGPEEKKVVIGVVKAGGSIADSAAIIGVVRKTVQNAMVADPDFRTAVRQAKAEGKVRLITKIGKARSWQAWAWILERTYGTEFGRKDRHEHTGRNGGPMQTATTVSHVIDYDQLRGDLEEFARGNGQARRGVPANGN